MLTLHTTTDLLSALKHLSVSVKLLFSGNVLLPFSLTSKEPTAPFRNMELVNICTVLVFEANRVPSSKVSGTLE